MPASYERPLWDGFTILLVMLHICPSNQVSPCTKRKAHKVTNWLTLGSTCKCYVPFHNACPGKWQQINQGSRHTLELPGGRRSSILPCVAPISRALSKIWSTLGSPPCSPQLIREHHTKQPLNFKGILPLLTLFLGAPFTTCPLQTQQK